MKFSRLTSIILAALCFISHYSYADNRGYLKIIFTNKSAVPAYQATTSTGSGASTVYQFTFTDSNLNKVFAGYTVLNFEKEYPIADSFPDDQVPAVRLRLVYKVVIDTTMGKSYDSLRQQIDTLHSSGIKATVRTYPAISLATPNDYNLPRSSLPGYTDNTWPDPYLQLNLVNALNAWNITTGLSCVKIGIIEQTPLEHHEDLDNKFLHQTSHESIAGSASFNGTHGTFTAGIAGASTNNGTGVASLGYNIGLRYYAFANKTSGYPQVVNAIYDKCKIINCSWFEIRQIKTQYSTEEFFATRDYWPPSQDVQDILDLAALNNITIVAGAGNGYVTSVNSDFYVYPASYDGVISVTSVGSQYAVGNASNTNWIDCHRLYFANSSSTDTGNYHNNNIRVDMSAPGYSIASTSGYGSSTTGVGNGYNAQGGSSFASPMVAAAAGLLYSVNPFFTPANILRYLYSNGANIDNACIVNGVSNNQQWAGRIGRRLDAGASLQAISASTYNGPAYCSGDFVNCPTQSTSISTNATLGQSNYFYNYDITAGTNSSGYVQTNTAAQTAFIATNAITLEPGFDANPSTTAIAPSASVKITAAYAYFTAYIEPCLGSVTGKEAEPSKPAVTSNSRSVQLYPNPATSEVHLFYTIEREEAAIIRVVNNLGITLQSKKVTSPKNGSGSITFSVKNLPAGMYYVILSGKNSHVVKKLIKINR